MIPHGGGIGGGGGDGGTPHNPNTRIIVPMVQQVGSNIPGNVTATVPAVPINQQPILYVYQQPPGSYVVQPSMHQQQSIAAAHVPTHQQPNFHFVKGVTHYEDIRYIPAGCPQPNVPHMHPGSGGTSYNVGVSHNTSSHQPSRSNVVHTVNTSYNVSSPHVSPYQQQPNVNVPQVGTTTLHNTNLTYAPVHQQSDTYRHQGQNTNLAAMSGASQPQPNVPHMHPGSVPHMHPGGTSYNVGVSHNTSGHQPSNSNVFHRVNTSYNVSSPHVSPYQQQPNVNVPQVGTTTLHNTNLTYAPVHQQSNTYRHQDGGGSADTSQNTIIEDMSVDSEPQLNLNVSLVDGTATHHHYDVTSYSNVAQECNPLPNASTTTTTEPEYQQLTSSMHQTDVSSENDNTVQYSVNQQSEYVTSHQESVHEQSNASMPVYQESISSSTEDPGNDSSHNVNTEHPQMYPECDTSSNISTKLNPEAREFQFRNPTESSVNQSSNMVYQVHGVSSSTMYPVHQPSTNQHTTEYVYQNPYQYSTGNFPLQPVYVTGEIALNVPVVQSVCYNPNNVQYQHQFSRKPKWNQKYRHNNSVSFAQTDEKPHVFKYDNKNELDVCELPIDGTIRPTDFILNNDIYSIVLSLDHFSVFDDNLEKHIYKITGNGVARPNLKFLQLPYWFDRKPENFIVNEWYVMHIPQHCTHLLLIATAGRSIFYNEDGVRFNADDYGNRIDQAKSLTILDCFCLVTNGEIKKIYILDVIAYNSQVFVNCPAQFRIQWIKMKMKDKEFKRYLSFRLNESDKFFNQINFEECDKEFKFLKVLKPSKFHIKTLLFYQKQSVYRFDRNPAVLCLLPFMAGEAFNRIININESYINEKPKDYVNMRKFIEAEETKEMNSRLPPPPSDEQMQSANLDNLKL